MEKITGLIPTLVQLVEVPGFGKQKKEIVMYAVLEILKKTGIYTPIIEPVISILIDGVVKIINSSKKESA